VRCGVFLCFDSVKLGSGPFFPSLLEGLKILLWNRRSFALAIFFFPCCQLIIAQQFFSFPPRDGDWGLTADGGGDVTALFSPLRGPYSRCVLFTKDALPSCSMRGFSRPLLRHGSAIFFPLPISNPVHPGTTFFQLDGGVKSQPPPRSPPPWPGTYAPNMLFPPLMPRPVGPFFWDLTAPPPCLPP